MHSACEYCSSSSCQHDEPQKGYRLPACLFLAVVLPRSSIEEAAVSGMIRINGGWRVRISATLKPSANLAFEPCTKIRMSALRGRMQFLAGILSRPSAPAGGGKPIRWYWRRSACQPSIHSWVERPHARQSMPRCRYCPPAQFVKNPECTCRITWSDAVTISSSSGCGWRRRRLPPGTPDLRTAQIALYHVPMDGQFVGSELPGAFIHVCRRT